MLPAGRQSKLVLARGWLWCCSCLVLLLGICRHPGALAWTASPAFSVQRQRLTATNTRLAASTEAAPSSSSSSSASSSAPLSSSWSSASSSNNDASMATTAGIPYDSKKIRNFSIIAHIDHGTSSSCFVGFPRFSFPWTEHDVIKRCISFYLSLTNFFKTTEKRPEIVWTSSLRSNFAYHHWSIGKQNNKQANRPWPIDCWKLPIRWRTVIWKNNCWIVWIWNENVALPSNYKQPVCCIKPRMEKFSTFLFGVAFCCFCVFVEDRISYNFNYPLYPAIGWDCLFKWLQLFELDWHAG